MNEGQNKFFDYILERVQEDKVEEVKALLIVNFQKQEDGTFTREDASQMIPKIISLLKPENVEEVQAVMKQFSQNIEG